MSERRMRGKREKRDSARERRNGLLKAGRHLAVSTVTRNTWMRIRVIDAQSAKLQKRTKENSVSNFKNRGE